MKIDKLLAKSEPLAYTLLMVVLAVSPIFFASNRELFWLPLQVIIFAAFLLLYAGMLHTQNISFLPKIYYQPFICGAGVVVAFILFQILPLGENSKLAAPIWQLTDAALGGSVSHTISTDVAATIDGLGRVLMYGTVFMLALYFGRSTERASKIIKLVLYTALGCTLYGVAMYLFDGEYILWFEKRAYLESLTGTFVNRNSFASLAGIGLIISLVYFFRRLFSNIHSSDGKLFLMNLTDNFFKKAYPYFAYIFIFYIAIILTDSRAGLVCATLAFFSTSIIFLSRLKLVKTRFKLPILMLLAACGVVLVYFVIIDQSFSERIHHLFSHGDLRKAIFAITSEAISNNWLLGTGFNSYEGNFYLYRDSSLPYYFRTTVDHAHNTYLELLLELGWPIFIVIMAMFGWVVFRAVRALQIRKRNTHFALIFLNITIMLGLHAFVDFSLEMPAVAIAFFALAGVSTAQSFSSRQHVTVSKEPFDFEKVTFAMIAALLVINLIVSLARIPSVYQNYDFAELDYKKASIKMSYDQALKGLHHYEDAFDGVFHPQYYRELGYFAFVAANKAENKADSLRYYQQALAAFNQSLAVNPLDSFIWYLTAYSGFMLGNDLEDVSKRIYISSLTGPYQRSLFYNRLTFLPYIWGISSLEEKEQYAKEIRFFWQQNSHLAAEIKNVLFTTQGQEIIAYAVGEPK